MEDSLEGTTNTDTHQTNVIKQWQCVTVVIRSKTLGKRKLRAFGRELLLLFVCIVSSNGNAIFRVTAFALQKATAGVPKKTPSE